MPNVTPAKSFSAVSVRLFGSLLFSVDCSLSKPSCDLLHEHCELFMGTTPLGSSSALSGSSVFYFERVHCKCEVEVALRPARGALTPAS